LGRACNQKKGTLCTKESPATNNLQQEKDRKPLDKMGRWRERMPLYYLAYRPGKQKPKIKNPGGNKQRRLRLNLPSVTA
jgi:hypothetical protein